MVGRLWSCVALLLAAVLLAACGGSETPTGPGEVFATVAAGAGATEDAGAEGAATDAAEPAGEPTGDTATAEATAEPAGGGAAGDLSDACSIFTVEQVSAAYGADYAVSPAGSSADACSYTNAANALQIVSVSVASSGGADPNSFLAAADFGCQDGTRIEVAAGDAAYACALLGIPTASALVGDRTLTIVGITDLQGAEGVQAAADLMAQLS